jgi:predicted amidohydrolase YtcJ
LKGLGPFLGIALLITAAGPVCSESPAPEPADLVLVNGHIRTSNGWVESLVIRRQMIVAAGTDAAVEGWVGPRTQRLDLHGHTVLPGLHDVHVHPMYAGITKQQCRIPQGSNLRKTQQLLRECAQRVAPDAWIVGGQWDVPALGRMPRREDIDAVVPDRPVYLEDTSGHSVWVNSRALAVTGISRETVNPEGGIIERDRTGAPTGLLRESATLLVHQHIPRPSVEQLSAALKAALDEMLSFGITAYTEAAVGFVAGPERELAANVRLADAGGIQQHATLCITWAPDDQEAEQFIILRNLYARAHLAPTCVKIFLDGVPTDSHTAAMLEPYVEKMKGRTDRAAQYGLLLVDQDVLNSAVTRFDRMGLTVKFHAAGDAAVHAGLEAIAAARQANGFGPMMHNVGHCTFVAVQDIQRARGIGATFEVSPYLWGPTPINDSIIAAVGPTLIERVWPVREMLNAGALVVPGSDWSVVPSVNPWPAIETLVTRKAPEGGPATFGVQEAITLPEALALFTVNAARQEGASHALGALDAGMQADLIVLDRDPYASAITDVHRTKVLVTMIGGRIAYQSADANLLSGAH